MNASASSSNMKTSQTRTKSSGWAAFNIKQREKQTLPPKVNKDPFPPIPGTSSTLDPSRNLAKVNHLSIKSFSSVLAPSVEFPPLAKNNDRKNQVHESGYVSHHNDKVLEEETRDLAFKMLKEMHCWADDRLIEDVYVATNNNFEKALALLEGMVSSSSSEEKEETRTSERSSMINEFQYNREGDRSSLPGKTTKLTDISSTISDGLKGTDKDLSDGHASDFELIMECLKSMPIEPDWEEDDIYLSHRKEALRMMRSASQHSRTASNAFLRGDHYAAQQYSLRAQEEWLAAERLNDKAAKEILSIRNSRNNIWKLDLHGLHAAEAVRAVQEHLQKIETLVTFSHSVSPTRVQEKNGITRSPSFESFDSMKVENSHKIRAPFKQRQTTLEVITGIGNHSRGQAALPTAVKNFLNENRYRFDEARPGVISVRLKFRHR